MGEVEPHKGAVVIRFGERRLPRAATERERAGPLGQILVYTGVRYERGEEPPVPAGPCAPAGGGRRPRRRS